MPQGYRPLEAATSVTRGESGRAQHEKNGQFSGGVKYQYYGSAHQLHLLLSGLVFQYEQPILARWQLLRTVGT
jgi:hypothetical protein